MQHFTPYSALLGGMFIGLSATLLLWFNGRIAGLSGMLGGVLDTQVEDKSWRALFLIGLIIGVAFYKWLLPSFVDSSYLHSLAPRTGMPVMLILAAGFLVGLGTAMGNGCTSGHGVCGLARLSHRSLYATLTFLGTGMVTVYAVRHLAGLP